ncbi:FecR family protein [Larkinella sp. C7]|jgi:transmembrane sensor|uniref:FecR family protein n=1 Tax=Larkinella sp. C7 TaxID=2576607 RepID=UPI00111157CC|nr:FecR domain-containing protein [Larkinella sp. C7]
MPPPNISPLLLDKYLRNQCTEQEKEWVEAWYASLRGNPDYIDSLPEPEQQNLQQETFLSIQNQLNQAEKPVAKTFSLGLGWLTGLAASIVLVIGFYFIYYYSARQQRSVSEPTALAHQATKNNRQRTIHFVNHEARPVKHQLPDRSSVWMHPGASIAYPEKFSADQRLVTFAGEGFFDVRKDPARPFRIQSGEMQIKVLGTSFNVKAPATHPVFQISVVTGRVQVSAPDHQQNEQQVILKPQQQAIFETASKRLVSSAIPVQARKPIYEPVTVTFADTPLDQVVKKLEKRFAIQIRLVNPKAASCLFSADFENQPLPLILEMLCTALEATYTMTGNVILLDSPPCTE